jgi:hypothetical protein
LVPPKLQVAPAQLEAFRHCFASIDFTSDRSRITHICHCSGMKARKSGQDLTSASIQNRHLIVELIADILLYQAK